MKKMKLMMMSVVIFTTMSVFAQKEGKGEMAQRKMDKMSEELNLTPEQKTKIEAINLEFKEAMKPLLSSKEANAETIAKLRKEHKTKMQNVLTPEQKKKREDLRQEKQSKGQAMKDEIKAYKVKNIDPVLKEKRILLEKELNDTEKKTIAEQRVKMNNAREQTKLAKSEFKATKKSGEAIDRNKLEELKKQNKTAKKEMTLTLKPIAKSHEKTLANIKESLMPNQLVWEKDIEAIRAKYPELEHKGEKQPGEKEKKKEKELKKQEPNKEKNKKGEEADVNHKMMQFLLLDPK